MAGSKKQLADVVKRPEPCRFDVLPAGSSTFPIQKLFRSPQFAQVLAAARERYDYVLLDTPPLVPVFDAAVLARSVDGVIVVVAAERTPRKLLAAALDLLDPAKVVGLVFNQDTTPIFGYYSNAYKPYFNSKTA
jgi:Mrp family chromosome partitioning ATPase